MEDTKQFTSEECFVAYLDILGFKNIVDTQSEEQILKIFEVMTNELNLRIAFHTATSDEDESEEGKQFKLFNEALDAITYYALSDSVVVSIPIRFEYGLQALIISCIFLQCSLYDFEPPIFLRGAITKGKFLHADRIAFGKAMVDAYLFEEHYSKYPRIIVSGELVNEFLDVNFKEKWLCEDETDKYLFVDCLKERFGNKHRQDDDVKRFEGFIQKHLDSYEDQSLREKYIWLRDNLHRVVFSNEVSELNGGASVVSILGNIYFTVDNGTESDD